MKPEDIQATFVATLVDEWVLCGLRHAVICPGSRSTPLALALAERAEISVQVHHDERSGAFLALGIGRETGRPAVVLTTSGTAAVELHPAVVEAHHGGVPMLVCTADRPPELRDVGAPQTIDQGRLYGGSVRWFMDPGVADWMMSGSWRAVAARAVAEATTGTAPGPVHLNLPFREPLVGTADSLPPRRDVQPPGSGTGAAATRWVASMPVKALAPSSLQELLHRLVGQDTGNAPRRGVIFAGEGSGSFPGVLGERLGWPVVADPRSQQWSASSTSVGWLDGVLRSETARARLRPEVILRLGEPPASRMVNEWCARSGAEEIVVSERAWSDPSSTAGLVVRTDPAAAAEALVQELASSAAQEAPRDWHRSWRAASDAAREALHRTMAEAAVPTEPGVARMLATALPAEARLVVSSSMPVRDIERYVPPRSDLRVLANRGANGIDGVVSTAVGVAVASGRPTGLLIGDVALLHDSNGLLGAAQRGVDLVIVVVDNDGGGIFSFLPQAAELPPERFELLFGTPHGLQLAPLAQAYGVAARELAPEEARDLDKHVVEAFGEGGVHVLVARTDRAANVAVHEQLDRAIVHAVEQVL